VLHRTLALLRARLSGARGLDAIPYGPLGAHALVSAVACGLVRGQLDPYPYALFALTLSGALLAVPLLGDLGALLRADPAREWVAALPVRRSERTLARALHLLVVLGILALGSLVPAALLAPAGTTLVERLALVGGGASLALTIAAGLLAAQSLLAGRAEALLVTLQLALVSGLVVGLVAGLHAVPELAGSADLTPARLWWYPPALAAAPLAPGAGALERLAPLLLGACALAVIALLPPPAQPTRRAGRTLVELALAPLRALATRVWVRRSERGVFDLVYDALPREREVVLRSYPMLGIPLAFLLAGGGEGEKALALTALVLFSPGVYLPVLLVHVPASESATASWLLRTAPVDARSVREGAFKAVAVRFVIPLHVALAFVAWQRGGLDMVWRLAVPATLVSLLVVRAAWSRCVTAPPLSTPPDELESSFEWVGLLGGIALGLAVLAAAAHALLGRAVPVLPVIAALVGLELLLGRRGQGATERAPSR
jgi:hypothetical protein